MEGLAQPEQGGFSVDAWLQSLRAMNIALESRQDACTPYDQDQVERLACQWWSAETTGHLDYIFNAMARIACHGEG